MDEADFWVHLEYRVCREIEGLRQPRLRCFWCDGFIPVRYDLDEPSPRVVGRVWMGAGPREQQVWEFVLLLRVPVESRETFVWSALLPTLDATRNGAACDHRSKADPLLVTQLFNRLRRLAS
jgi:hypothetical protein